MRKSITLSEGDWRLAKSRAALNGLTLGELFSKLINTEWFTTLDPGAWAEAAFDPVTSIIPGGMPSEMPLGRTSFDRALDRWLEDPEFKAEFEAAKLKNEKLRNEKLK